MNDDNICKCKCKQDAFTKLYTCNEIHVILETAVYTGDGTGGSGNSTPHLHPLVIYKDRHKIGIQNGGRNIFVGLTPPPLSICSDVYVYKDWHVKIRVLK